MPVNLQQGSKGESECPVNIIFHLVEAEHLCVCDYYSLSHLLISRQEGNLLEVKMTIQKSYLATVKVSSHMSMEF